MTAEEVLLAYCSHPAEGAVELARTLVDLRLAACVQVAPGVTSVYRWKGNVETAEEVRLEIKTTRGRLDALVAAIRGRHPYELPEIVAVAAGGGDPHYLDWIRDETRIA